MSVCYLDLHIIYFKLTVMIFVPKQKSKAVPLIRLIFKPFCHTKYLYHPRMFKNALSKSLTTSILSAPT